MSAYRRETTKGGIVIPGSRYAHFKRREIVCRVSAGLIMVSGLLFFCRGSFVIFIASATLVVECIRVKQAGCSYERDGHLQLELVVIYQAQINRADYRRSSSSSVSCLAFRVRQILRLMNSSLYFCWIMFDEWTFRFFDGSRIPRFTWLLPFRRSLLGNLDYLPFII